MNGRSLLRSRKWLFSLILVLVLILIALVLAIFVIKQQLGPVYHPGLYPANIDYEPAGYGTYNLEALSNPNIDGVVLNLNWSKVEPQQGAFNFRPIDKEIAAWARAGKKFVVAVRYVNESGIVSGKDCNIPQYLPAWEIPRIPHFCDTDRRTIIPDYFSPTFKADLKAYVKEVAEHFAQSPYRNSVAYVRVGVGLEGEGFYLMPCNGGYRGCSVADFQADKAKLVSYGYSPVAWKNWQEEMMTYNKSVFSYARVIYPIVDLDTDPTTGQSVQMEVAYWAAAHGMGVGAQGLVPILNYSYAQLNIIIPYILSHYPATYIQFQTVAVVSSASEVQGDIQAAERYGARSIEWYSRDTTNPAYQPLFQQWKQTVDTKLTSTGNLIQPQVAALLGLEELTASCTRQQERIQNPANRRD